MNISTNYVSASVGLTRKFFVRFFYFTVFVRLVCAWFSAYWMHISAFRLMPLMPLFVATRFSTFDVCVVPVASSWYLLLLLICYVWRGFVYSSEWNEDCGWLFCDWLKKMIEKNDFSILCEMSEEPPMNFCYEIHLKFTIKFIVSYKFSFS